MSAKQDPSELPASISHRRKNDCPTNLHITSPQSESYPCQWSWLMISRLFPLIVVFLALAASGQDWQDCKPDGDYSFKDVKASVRRVTTTGMYTGWDEKTFNRSGDLVAVAIIRTLD